MEKKTFSKSNKERGNENMEIKVKPTKVVCGLLIVYLQNEYGQVIKYGDLTQIAKALPRTIEEKNGMEEETKKNKREYIPYTKTQYEMWQHKYTNHIVKYLNKRLQRRNKNTPTHYFTQMENILVKGYAIDETK